MKNGSTLRGLPLVAATLFFLSSGCSRGCRKAVRAPLRRVSRRPRRGTERGPALVNNRSLRSRSGKADPRSDPKRQPGGMPPFALPEEQLQPLARWVRSLNTSAYDLNPPGDAARRRAVLLRQGPMRFVPHGAGPRASERAGPLRNRARTDAARDWSRRSTIPARAGHAARSSILPSWAWCPGRIVAVVERAPAGWLRSCADLLRSQGKHDLQLQTLDGRLHLLLDTEYAEVTREKAALCRR